VRDINRLPLVKEFLIYQQISRISWESLTDSTRYTEVTREYGENSKFGDQLSLTLESISEASRSFDKTNRILQRNPNALLVGDN